MATGSAVRAGAAYVELLVKDTALLAGLTKAGNTLKSFGAGLAKIGGAFMAGGFGILAPLGNAVNAFVETGTQLNRVSEATGMSVENLAALKKLAGESGVSFEELTTDLNKFQQNLGSGKAAKALQDLGIAAGDLNGKTMAEQLAIVADGFAKIEDPAKRAAAARELFGRGARSLIPVLARGGDAMREYMQAAGMWTTADAKRAEEFERDERRITGAINNIRMQFGGAIVEAFGGYLKPLVQGAKAAAEWVKEHRQIAVTAAAVGAALVTVGGIFTGAALGIAVVGQAVTQLAAGLTFLVSPLGLSIVAVGAFTAALAYAWKTCESGKIAIAGIAADWSTAWGGILASVQSGEFQDAWAIALKAVELTWARFTASIGKEFDALLTRLDPRGGTQNKLARLMNEAWGGARDIGEVFKAWGTLFSTGSLDEARKQFRKNTDEIHREIGATEKELRTARDPALNDDARIKRLEKELATMRKRALDRVANQLKPAGDSKKDSMAALMGVSEAAKGTFSPYAISQALAYSDRLGERIAQAAEAQVGEQKKTNEKLDAMKGGGGGPFRDDGG